MGIRFPDNSRASGTYTCLENVNGMLWIRDGFRVSYSLPHKRWVCQEAGTDDIFYYEKGQSERSKPDGETFYVPPTDASAWFEAETKTGPTGTLYGVWPPLAVSYRSATEDNWGDEQFFWPGPGAPSASAEEKRDVRKLR